GGGNAGARAQILGEALRSFEPRRGGRGTEDRDADRAQPVGEACDERRFRADDDEVDGVRPDEGDEAVEVVGGNRYAFGVRLYPRVAGSGIELGAAWRLCQLPA